MDKNKVEKEEESADEELVDGENDEETDEENQDDPFGPTIPDSAIQEETEKDLQTKSGGGPLLDIVIIPKIIEHKVDNEDIEVEEILEDMEEDEEDKHQHYFCDQIHFVRPKWPKFWFSAAAMVAFAVDLSNLEKFPRYVATHGGLSYIIVYMLVVVFMAFPAVYLEVLVGQYFQTGMIGIWGLTPIVRGLGFGLFFINFLLISVIPVNTMWAFLMTGEALGSVQTGQLPWISCKNDWNSCSCSGNRIPKCLEYKKRHNITSNESYSPAMEYFISNTLRMWKSKHFDPITVKDITQNGNWTIAYGFNNGKEGLGPLIASSCFILIAVFIFILLLNLSNLKYIGYFYTFTTSLSFLILGLLFCRTVTIDGAFDGLRKYFKTDLRKVFYMSTWYAAFENAFFSIGFGCGCHFVMASFNSLSHNVRRDAIICVAVDTVTSCIGSVIGFMFVGHLYTIQRLPLPDKYPWKDFVFITLAESFSTISGSSFFAALFYFMIATFTLDTQLVLLHTISYSLYEEYSRKYPEQTVSKLHFLFGVGGLALSVTLMCATRGGYWLYEFVNTYVFTLSPLVFMLIEIFVFSWIWGIDEICIAGETILGHRPSMFLRVCWKYIMPIFLLTQLVYANLVKTFEPINVFEQKGSPFTAQMGFSVEIFAIVLVTCYSIYTFLKTRGQSRTCLQVILLLISPEYEHEKILEDAQSSKRLTWKHYTFIQYQDEKHNWHIMELFEKVQQKMQIVLKAMEKSDKKKATSTTKSSKKKEKKEKKKKKQLEEKVPGDENNPEWNLWNKLEKEKGEVEKKVEPVEVVEKAPPATKKKIRKIPSKVSNKTSTSTSKDSMNKKKVKGKVQRRGSKVTPARPSLK